jgi:Cu-processing system ATP-binding protein
MIAIQHLYKKFKKLQALDNISAEMDRGQVIALIGPNASGKTTLIKCLLGLVRPDSGNILFNGENIAGKFGYRNRLGYMPQTASYPPNMKTGQLFNMLKGIRNNPQFTDNDLVKAFALEQMYQKPVKTLSGGTRQKVSAALAFLFDPEVLILDEPTAGLDPLATEILKEKISVEKKKNKLLLITSHILSDLEEFSTHVIYLHEGKILFYKSLENLFSETGESRLGKVVASIMKSGLPKGFKTSDGQPQLKIV